jgi:hypothetical protein
LIACPKVKRAKQCDDEIEGIGRKGDRRGMDGVGDGVGDWVGVGVGVGMRMRMRIGMRLNEAGHIVESVGIMHYY